MKLQILIPTLWLILCIIAIITVEIKLKRGTDELEQLKHKINGYISAFNFLKEEDRKLKSSIQKAESDKAAAQKSADEAIAMTDKILKVQEERLKAEIEVKRQLEEERLNQDLEKKEQAYLLQYKKQIYEMDKELLEKQKVLQDFRDIQDSINEAIRRAKELKEKSDFYSLQIPPNDKEDIQILQSMDLKLHHREVIPKIIWELFIRRPAQEMIKRVVGTEKKSGIYKITNKETGEAYIGKTSDFSTRWQNHLKTAIGLEGAAHATLHTRLAQDGVWNYTFEIIEEVNKDQLSERESYYIDLYGTKSQLNMKEGSK